MAIRARVTHLKLACKDSKKPLLPLLSRLIRSLVSGEQSVLKPTATFGVTADNLLDIPEFTAHGHLCIGEQRAGRCSLVPYALCAMSAGRWRVLFAGLDVGWRWEPMGFTELAWTVAPCVAVILRTFETWSSVYSIMVIKKRI
jgi:hypothetical protein